MRLHHLVAEAARRHPRSLAVAAQDYSVTYGQLDEMADRFAGSLRRRGVQPGDRVMLWSGKSALAVALMQGVLRAGAVYVPVAASNPAARVARVIADSSAAVVAVGEDAADEITGVPGELAPYAGKLVRLPGLLADAPSARTVTHDGGDADDPAYILYTSGSTGTPKGVCLSHRNALAFVEWAARVLDLGPEDRLSNHAPFNFDLSVFDLYGAFRAGASVHLIPPGMAYAPGQLVQFIRDRRISVWYSVPSALALMMREGGLLDAAPPPGLRACLFAGESFPIRQVQALRKAWPAVRLLNWYGPTETNVCTSYEVTDADLARTGSLPIGTPASGDTIIVDPPGDEGEIVVSGPTVMLGYWGRPPQTGAYRTGDKGRMGRDGNLEYVGRIDRMVKVRGNRVEPGEIETVLCEDPAVAEAAVIVVGDGLGARLHAVVVPAGPARPRLLALKQFSAQRLPAYMVIDALHVVPALPLTPNGKIDRAALATAMNG